MLGDMVDGQKCVIWRVPLSARANARRETLRIREWPTKAQYAVCTHYHKLFLKHKEPGFRPDGVCSEVGTWKSLNRDGGSKRRASLSQTLVGIQLMQLTLLRTRYLSLSQPPLIDRSPLAGS
jgi:hypothetical protein